MKNMMKAMSFLAMAAVAAAMIGLTGCEKGGGGGNDEPANVAGDWKGRATRTGGRIPVSGTIYVNLAQDGENVSGMLELYRLSGKVTGNNIVLRGEVTGAVMELEGTVDGDVMYLSGPLKWPEITYTFTVTLTRMAGK